MMYRFLLFIIFSALYVCSVQAGQPKQSYGAYEKIAVKEFNNLEMKAKLDTGALTSSLGADNITVFEKDGEEWVRFTPQVDGAVEAEFPIVRNSRIKRRPGTEQSVQNRPVVVLNICFDGNYYPLEVNLTDRENFNYPFLLGRSALIEMNAMVDPSGKYTAEPDCK